MTHDATLSEAMLVWIGRANETIVEALLVKIGWWHDSWPHGNDQRLVRKLGSNSARDLLPKLRELKDDFYQSKAWEVAPGLREMADMSAAEFRPRHPELSEEAIRALAVCYTFIHK